jgi:hypothetical protein
MNVISLYSLELRATKRQAQAAQQAQGKAPEGLQGYLSLKRSRMRRPLPKRAKGWELGM